MRYKCWRSNSDKTLHVICYDGRFEELPHRIRGLGPWIGSREGDIDRLKRLYRLQLAEQNFAVVYRHPANFAPEQA
jgi:hypothetical protein